MVHEPKENQTQPEFMGRIVILAKGLASPKIPTHEDRWELQNRRNGSYSYSRARHLFVFVSFVLNATTLSSESPFPRVSCCISRDLNFGCKSKSSCSGDVVTRESNEHGTPFFVDRLTRGHHPLYPPPPPPIPHPRFLDSSCPVAHYKYQMSFRLHRTQSEFGLNTRENHWAG